MAFLFNEVSDDAAEAGKQNIFGGQQTDQGTTTGGATEGAVDKGGPQQQATGGGGGGSQPKAPQPAKTQMAYSPQAQSRAYASAAQKMKLPTAALSRAEGTLNQGSQKLQEQANAYGQKAQETAKGYEVDTGTLAQAAAGDQAAYQKTAQRLQQATPAPAFEAFQGLSELPAIQNIRDPGSLYRAEAGPNYSAGQSRFDAALLRRNPEFIKKQQELLARGKTLESESAKAATEETKKARDFLAAQYEKSTGDIKQRLGGMGEEIVSAAKQKEAAEDARRAGLDPKALAAAEQEKIKAQIREDLKNADPRSEQARSLKYLDEQFDLGNFANIDRDTDWREFIGQGDAQKYNAVQGLLGGAEMLTPSMGGPGEGSSFNQAGAYRNILDQIQGKRRAQDVKSKAEIEQLIGGAQGKAQRLQSEDQARNAKEEAMKNLVSYARAKYGAEGGNMGDLAQLHAQDLFQNQGNYQKLLDQGLIRENLGTDWRSVLDPATSTRLNELTRDIGGLETYGGGDQYRPEYDMQQLTSYYDQFVNPFMERYRADLPKPGEGPGRIAAVKPKEKQQKFQD